MEALTLAVTGSRTFTDPATVYRCLDMCLRPAARLGTTLEVWHGRCRSGPDAYADAWVLRQQATWRRKYPGVACPVQVRRFPADWAAPCRAECAHGPRGVRRDGSTYCQTAGFYRNQEMVDAGPLAVLGFWRGGSRGTRHCMDVAKAAGVPVACVEWGTRHSAALTVQALVQAFTVGFGRAVGQAYRQNPELFDAIEGRVS